MELEYLTVKEILQIHLDVIEDSGGGGTGIREMAGVESAVANTKMELFGQDAYPSIAEKAAVLGFEIITQHPFVDGNKRVGHAAIAHFLFLNDYFINEKDDEQERVILLLASSKMERDEFTEWLRKRIKPI